MDLLMRKQKIASRWTALGCLSMPFLVIEWVWRTFELFGLEFSLIAGLLGAFFLSVLWQATEARVVQTFCPLDGMIESTPIIPLKIASLEVSKGRVDRT
ncbi:hypothetical protein AB6D11_00210 [Vibrio splendidus]